MNDGQLRAVLEAELGALVLVSAKNPIECSRDSEAVQAADEGRATAKALIVNGLEHGFPQRFTAARSTGTRLVRQQGVRRGVRN